MPRGGKLFLTAGALAMTACAADNGSLDIRPIADPLAAAAKRGNPMVVEGRNFLALGSVGLAIEAFRKASRAQPDNIEALAGLAECYERMGRYDVAGQKYEEALAIAPNNSLLLNTFAASLERQGLRSQAAELRSEAVEADAASIAALTATVPAAERLASLQQQVPPREVPLQTPAVQPVKATAVASRLTEVPLPKQPTPAVQPLTAAPTGQAPPSARAIEVPVPAKVAQLAIPAKVREVAVPAKSIPRPAESQSVGTTEWTFELPQPSIKTTAPVRVADLRSTRVDEVRVADVTPDSVTLALPAAQPAPTPAKAPRAAELPKLTEALATNVRQPRLERLSLGEVALVTTGGPIWTPKVVAESRQSVTVRFVPLRQANASTPNVRVLNAARRQGLAALHRNVLLDRGWRRIAIGDAAEIREQSLVLYPEDRRALGRSLAAQFGFRSAVSNDSKELVVLVGRDAWLGRPRHQSA